MVALLFRPEVIRETQNAQGVPAFATLMFSHPQVFFGAFLVISATTLVSAIGLLKRQNWARLVFIGILALGIVWNLGGLVLMFIMSSSMPPVPEHTPADFRDGFDIMWKVMMGFSVLIALVFAGLFGWIIRRLVSREIKSEFLAL